MFVAATKGLVAGAVNLGLALILGQALPAPGVAGLALAVGFLGYGVSLVLFVLALRHLGTAPRGPIFPSRRSSARHWPSLLQGDVVTIQLLAAGLLMAAGVWLHLAERHVHSHAHGLQEHAHMHSHDEHHRHAHAFPWDGREPHSHAHSIPRWSIRTRTTPTCIIGTRTSQRGRYPLPGGTAPRCSTPGHVDGQCFAAASDAGALAPAVSARTGAFTSTVCVLPSFALKVSVTGTVSPSFSGATRPISITW